MTTESKMSRRQFVGTAAAGAAALGAVAGATTLIPRVAASPTVAGAKAAKDTGTVARAGPVPIPSSWDYTADVVVVGYGGAGAASAITAAENGASVIILEKASAPGGNTSCASGHLQWASNAIGAAEYVLTAGLGTLTTAQALAIGTQLTNVGTFLTNHNVTLAPGNPTSSTASGGFPGAQYYNWNASVASHDGYPAGTGKDFFQYLAAAVNKQSGIQVMLSTPAQHLVQDPASRTVVGVQANSSGQIINVKANKGVIMALGGYEGNRDMISAFNDDNPVAIYPAGTPYNTGDGINMVTEVGAKLWHMQGFEYGYYGFKPSVFPSAFWLQPGGAGTMYAYIIVNSAGSRFHAESTSWGHIKTKPEPQQANSAGSGIAGIWPNYPFYMIFDNTILTQGPVGMTQRSTTTGPTVGWNFSFLHGDYTWSKDNSVEVANGWIVQGKDLPTLAAALNINAAGLQTQVTNWNSMCAAGADTQLGRTASTMKPIINPPYCGIQMCMTMINTQGGGKRNERNQILDTMDNPIPHLYGAGEFGSYYGFWYSGSNLGSGVADGLTSGADAAAQAPWSS